MKRIVALFCVLLPLFSSISIKGEKSSDFQFIAPPSTPAAQIRLKSNLLPWLLTIPNIGAEYTLGEKWSASLDVMFCPWKLSERFSVKTVSILPEGRWWLKSNRKGSFFNIHLNIAWFNVRANAYRYQDVSYPLIGGGVGYGYRLPLNNHWGFEFEIGAGISRTKYDRFYNIPNGALKDTRVSTYWGIDRACVSVTYNISGR